jgi:hypothetical protein
MGQGVLETASVIPVSFFSCQLSRRTIPRVRSPETTEQALSESGPCPRLSPSSNTCTVAEMLTIHDIEGLRRPAAMAPLSHTQTLRVLDEIDGLVRERAEIARVLADLPTSFGAVRS